MTYGKSALRSALLLGAVAVDAGRRNDDEEKKGKEEDKLDATLDKLLTKMDACMSRMDAIEERFAKKDSDEKKDSEKEEKADGEKKPGDAEMTAADKAKKDSEKEDEKKDGETEPKDAKKDESKEEKREDVKDDAARADAAEARRENAALKKQLDDLAKRVPTERTDTDINVMTGIQARADAAFRAHGVTTGAPRFLNGEDALGYRRRLAREHQAHSKAWKEADLGVLNDSVLTIAEDAIYADSLAVAADPKTHASGGLRMVRGETPTGHKEIKFFGQPKDWMGRFGGSQRFVTKLNPSKQEIN